MTDTNVKEFVLKDGIRGEEQSLEAVRRLTDPFTLASKELHALIENNPELLNVFKRLASR